VPDPLFAAPRLAAIYDAVEGERADLDHYLAIAAELGARSVLDVGCGTGTFACLLADRGLVVVGVDPTAASLDIARAKPGARRVLWVLGDVASLPELAVDLVTMTGHTSQVFLTDEEWDATLRGIHAALRPGGQLVFEARDPARETWQGWNREATYVSREIPGVGVVETWWDLTEVSGEYVSYRRTYVFAADGTTLTEVRGAPDRPGRELVFMAGKPLPGGPDDRLLRPGPFLAGQHPGQGFP